MKKKNRNKRKPRHRQRRSIITHTLSPLITYNPSGASSTPLSLEYTRSWQSSRITFTTWSNPLSVPTMCLPSFVMTCTRPSTIPASVPLLPTVVDISLSLFPSSSRSRPVPSRRRALPSYRSGHAPFTFILSLVRSLNFAPSVSSVHASEPSFFKPRPTDRPTDRPTVRVGGARRDACRISIQFGPFGGSPI